jgi:energy-coupling factor transporter ATP-binding protein EcfA2
MDSEIMGLFTDNPISSVAEDKFGIDHFAVELKDLILVTERLPFCVGIFGAWGSGKTSFMNMLQGLIKEQADDKIKTIWFNPWKYDKKEDLWNALIQTILNSIAEDQTVSPEVKEKVKKMALATTWLALKKAITAITAGVISEANLDDLIKSFNEQDETYYRHINYFEKDFAEVVKHYTKDAKDGKLVVFIDDLDRCLPENAITVLESLKLFIGDANCIFVLGMDHSIVEAGIKTRYGKNAPIAGRDYLDKIIQVPFFLPPVSYEKLKDSLQVDVSSKALTDDIWNVIHLSMGSNPRKTRRFVNSFYLSQRFLNHPDQVLQRKMQEGIVPALTPEAQNMYLAKILVFQMSFPDFYQHLQRYPGDWEYLDKYVIQQDDSEKRTDALNKRERLGRFWKNEDLQTFMRKTSGRSYRGAPVDEIVSQLLQATNLVQATEPETD